MSPRSAYYNVRGKHDRRRLEVVAAETSAVAFMPIGLRSTPPAKPLDPAQHPRLNIVPCPSYGKLPLASCRGRFAKANARPPRAGQGAMDSSDLRLSACNGCEVGAERSGRAVKLRQAVALRPCIDGCGEQVSVRGRCEACVELARTREALAVNASGGSRGRAR